MQFSSCTGEDRTLVNYKFRLNRREDTNETVSRPLSDMPLLLLLPDLVEVDVLFEVVVLSPTIAVPVIVAFTRLAEVAVVFAAFVTNFTGAVIETDAGNVVEPDVVTRYQFALGSFRHSPIVAVVYPCFLRLSIMNCTKPCTVLLWMSCESGIQDAVAGFPEPIRFRKIWSECV
jgi:hypothetical protein